MAKKKSKKSAQKQVEVVAPSDNIEPATAVATEEPLPNEATPDVPGPSLAPPPEATNEEVLAGPTSVPGPDLEDVHAEPREDEAPVVEEATPSSLVGDHVETYSPAPEQKDAAPAIDLQNHDITEETSTHEILPDEPVVTEEEPVATEEEPIVTEEEPRVTEEEPLVTEEEPLVTEEEPLVTEEEPLVTEEEPLVTEEEPLVTEEEPLVTEEEPVVTEEEPLDTEAVEPPHEESGDLVDAQLETTSNAPTEAPTEPISEDPLDGEPHSEPVEVQAEHPQTELFSPVEPQPATVLEDVFRADEAHDEVQAVIEAPVASDPTVETPNLEIPEEIESAIDKSEQEAIHEPLDDAEQESGMDDLHGARAPELLPEESFEPIFPESPIQTATELPEVEVPALISQDHFLRDESTALADAPLSGDLPSTVSSDVLSTESRIAPTGEAPPTNDTKSVAQDENEPSAQEHVHVEPEVSFEVTDPLPVVKETSKQRRRREADEAIQREDEEIMQREEQDRLDQASFEQYRIDQERLEMARLEQKRLEREKARQERRRKEQLEQARLEKERAEQDRLEAERREEERLEVESLERERLAKERIEQDRIARETLERERLENERLEAERLTDERLERERLERERLESERLEKERLEKKLRDRARIEQQILDNAKLERQRIEQERLDQERLHAQRLQEEAAESRRIEQQQIENEATEQARFDSEVKADSEAAEMARTNALEAEAARIAKEHEVQIQEFAEKIATGLNVEQTTSSLGPQQRAILDATTARVHVSTPHPETLPRPSPASRGVRTSNPVSRLPTPAASVGQTSSPHSVASDPPRSRAHAVEPPPQAAHAHRAEEPHLTSNGRNTSSSPALPAPRPQAVSQLIEENRPPAPSPPVARARPRHIPAFDSEDDSDSALVRPRRQFRGGEDPHDYRQPAHHRFASRVPAHEEPSVPSYSNPPPPQPPGYHPGYYPPTAPPHYQNHNYRVSQQGYPPPNPYGPPSHSSSSPYTEPWNYPPGYRHDSPPQRHDTLVTRDYPLGLAPIDTRSPLGADPGDVFSRISQAIPDLHVLLAQYKEAHSQLSVREDLLRRSAVEQEERLRGKDDEIADLKERNRSQEHRFSTEANRLRLQIGDLEEQARELHQQRIETDRVKREAYDTRSAFDAAMRSWEAKYKELEEAHAVLARTSAEKTTDFDEWKSNYTTRNDAEKIALAIHFDQRLKDADVLAETQRQEAAAAFVAEKDELRSESQRQQLERQASFERVRNELETKLGAAQLDREESLRQDRESREVWLAEREALIKAHEDDRERFHKGWDEQRDLLDAQYQKSKDESDKAWIELHADASRRADEEKARVNQLMQEKEELLRRYNALRAESEKEKAIIKSVATNLESEKSRLEKLMECYGDIAEIKSKGDSY